MSGMWLKVPPELYGREMQRSLSTLTPRRTAWGTNEPQAQERPKVTKTKSNIEISTVQWNNNKNGTQPSGSVGRRSVRRSASRNSTLAPPAQSSWNHNRAAGQDSRRSRPPSAVSLHGNEEVGTPRCGTSRPSSRRASILPPPKPSRPQSAWEIFEEQIKQIDDSTPYFARNQRNFRSSDIFKQVLDDIDYEPPVENKRRNSDTDFDPVMKINVQASGDYGNEADESGDTGTAKVSPRSVASAVDDAWDDLGRSTHGFRAPARMSILEDILGEEEEEKNSKDAQYIAVKDLTSDPEKSRQALYHRYLARPDTWASGLKKYLQKNTARERVSTVSGPPTMGFRPRSTSQYMINPAESNQLANAAKGRTHTAYADAANRLSSSSGKPKRVQSAGRDLRH